MNCIKKPALALLVFLFASMVFGAAFSMGSILRAQDATSVLEKDDNAKQSSKETIRKPVPNEAPAVMPGADSDAADESNAADPPGLDPRNLLAQNPPLITRVEAYAGVPFGVGKISFRLGPGDELIKETAATILTEQNRRIFYPVIAKSPFRQFLQTVTRNDSSHTQDLQTIWFLFRGDQPLNIALQGTGVTNEVVPVEFARENKYQRFTRQWWREFNQGVDYQIKRSDYPAIVETYLTSMLGRRMGLGAPRRMKTRRDPLAQTFDLLFDVESLKLEEIERAMSGQSDYAAANVALPPPIQWGAPRTMTVANSVAIEPMAECVPEECFYLRFGTWQNQLWLQRLLEEYGGDLSRMIQLRGYRPKIQSKFLDQLAIESTEFDQLFGGNLIDDVAVIGMDTYFDEGSAIGVLLHAKKTESLKNNLTKKRTKFAEKNKKIGAELNDIVYEGSLIQFLSTPDNRYRSFYVTVGDCHLMTTSLTIAKRFVEASAGKRNLANNSEFRYARTLMPLDRDDTLFIYMTSRFFQELLSPQYQIELRRRNRVITDMQLLEVAQLAAAHEGIPINDLNQMVQHGFLPQGFGNRPDQSLFAPKGSHWVDSIRGRRGFFTPIPDVKMQLVSPDEANWFRERAAFFTKEVGSLDPMLVAVKRYQREEKIERVVFDARVAPFGQDKYGWLMAMLGPPLKEEIATSPGDMISLQASMQGGKPNPRIPPHHIFAAVQDAPNLKSSLKPTTAFRILEILREAPVYIGSWPRAGYLDWMPSLGGAPDEFGYTYSRLLNIWRLQWNDFAVIAFDQSRLESLKPHLRPVPAERAAQIRIRVGDLANSHLNTWANTVNYQRSWQTSVANVRLLNMLGQQFGISPETAKSIAERMLNVELVCSLDGEYQISQLPSGRKIWGSNRWPNFASPELPNQYSAPLLKWFRGLEMEVIKGESQFAVHGFVDIQRQAEEPTVKLPGIELFKGFGNLFSGGDKSNKKKNEPKSDK